MNDSCLWQRGKNKKKKKNLIEKKRTELYTVQKKLYNKYLDKKDKLSEAEKNEKLNEIESILDQIDGLAEMKDLFNPNPNQFKITKTSKGSYRSWKL